MATETTDPTPPNGDWLNDGAWMVYHGGGWRDGNNEAGCAAGGGSVESVAIAVGAKGPASSVHRLPRNLRKNQKKGAALKESGAFAQISSRGGTGEYLPIDGSTHSDPPSSL